MKTLTLEQLIEAAEICGSGKEGACQVCPAHNDGEVVSSACIESVMAQASARTERIRLQRRCLRCLI